MRNRMKQLTLTTLALMLFGGLASGECTTNIKVPIDWWYWIASTGDEVYCQGFMHISLTYTEDNAGGIHGKTHFQPQGLSGQVVWGPNLGATYQGTGVTQDTFNAKKGQTYTFVNNYRCLGQGSTTEPHGARNLAHHGQRKR